MDTKDIIEKATEFSRDFELPTKNIDGIKKAVSYCFEETRETASAIALYECATAESKFDDLEEIIDGFGDVAFVAINGIYKAFIMIGDSHDVSQEKTYEVLNRICDANNAKRGPNREVIRNKDGKVMKPEGWVAPTYTDLL